MQKVRKDGSVTRALCRSLCRPDSSQVWGLGFLLGAGLACAACNSDSEQESFEDVPPVAENYAALLHAGYDDALSGAHDLREALQPLMAGEAEQADLDTARQVWVNSRISYQQTEFARFYNGPIDDPERGNLEAMINPWPLDEATIDYVRGTDGEPLDGGMINMPDSFPDLSGEVLSQQNMVPGEENVTTGYHAIEFLLWGQDFNPDGPGDRPYTDYVEEDGANVDRRREYLDVASQLLIDQLTEIRDAWEADADNYAKTFTSMDPKRALGLILVGMGKFAGAELANQRINVAVTSKDQEDEHSCFSDNTNADLMNDVLGLANLYYGRYERTDGSMVEGASLSDLVSARDAELDKRVRKQVDKALSDIRAWPEVDACPSEALQGECPFDQLVVGTDEAPGRKALLKVIHDLRDLSTSVVDIANLFDIDIHDDLSGTGGE